MDSHRPAMRRRQAIAPTHEAVQAALNARRAERAGPASSKWSVVALAAVFGILATFAMPGAPDKAETMHSGFEQDEFQYAEPLNVEAEMHRYEGTRSARLTMLLVFSLRRGPSEALELARTAMRERIHIAEQHAQNWLQAWAKDRDRTGVFETAYSIEGFDQLTGELDKILFPGGEAKLRRLHIASLKFH